MNNDYNNQQGFGGGLSYQGPGVPQQPMMQQPPMAQPTPDMNMAQPQQYQQPMADPNMMQQQPMMQQPMQYQQPMGGGAPAAPKSNSNKLILLIPVGMVALLVLILLINLIATKTLKCSTESEAFGVAYKMETIVKYKFGKPKKITAKDQKNDLKDSCKSKDGCSYSIKKSGKKLIVSQTKKIDKEDLEDEDDSDYESTKEHLEAIGLECK